MHISGSCHCGNIALELDWPYDSGALPARACNCSFCTRHGAVWTSHRRARLRVSIADLSLVSDYRFGTGTAVFKVCARCGIVPLVTSLVDDRLHAVVNVNVLADLRPEQLERRVADFEGEDVASRLARRQRNWIADVQFSTRGA